MNTGTVCAQSLTLDSCICYTDKQDANCLECLNNQLHKDGIIIEQKKKIEIRDSIIVQDSIKFDALGVEYDHQKELAKDNANKLNRCRKWNKIKNAASMIGGVFIGWIVRKTVFQ